MDPFFELLQMVALTREDFSAPVDEAQWRRLFSQAQAHSLLGVTFPAVKMMSGREGTTVPHDLLMLWWAAEEKIVQANDAIRQRTAALHTFFLDNGYRSCLLKGQSAAALYPQPLLRQSGDIDLWVEGDMQKLVDFLRGRFPVKKVVYHHCDVTMLRGVKVEVHFTPTWMNSFRKDRRLQRWFASEAEAQFSHFDPALGCNVPTLRFNGVFLMVHLFRHVLEEGVGLRQFLDYHFLLTQLEAEDRAAVAAVLKDLGLLRFTRAAMSVLREVFATDEALLLCPPDPRGGAFLLQEVLRSGNFGHTDARNAHREDEGLLAHSLRKLRRAAGLLFQYPSEVLSMPVFMLWQYLWRRRRGYLYKGR